jgi:ribosomal protein S18 acetylase RimI-like enzyme
MTPPRPSFPAAMPPSDKFSGPRRASFPRDVPQIAVLVELGFDRTLDYSSRMVLRNVRWIAERGELFWKLSLLTGSMNPEEWALGTVWEEAGRVVGNLTLTRRAPETGAWLMSNVAVHPDFRRRGVGRGMIRFALEEIRSRGGRNVYLQVDAGNETALRMYRELGFGEIGCRISWTRGAGPAPDGSPAGGGDPSYRITPRRGPEWRTEFALWKALSPAGFAWNTPLTEGIFRPSAGRALEQALGGESEKHFLAWRGERVAASLYAVRRISGWEGFLMQSEGTGGGVERMLLKAAWNGAVPDRNCLLETVPESSGEVLAELGFVRRRTFIWMRYTFDGGGV